MRKLVSVFVVSMLQRGSSCLCSYKLCAAVHNDNIDQGLLYFQDLMYMKKGWLIKMGSSEKVRYSS